MKNFWVSGAIALGLTGLVHITAWAQDGEAAAEAEAQVELEGSAEEAAGAATEEPKRRRRMMLDEIKVTAQRREEDVRDVPMSVSVLSGDDMRDAGVTQFNDIAQLVPNISINTDWFTVYMRGVGTSEVNVMAEQAVAYMFDDVYVARVEFLRAGFLDVERLEVLKGPNGTLFGRNSPAGVINVTQGAPTYEWESRFEGTIGQLETRELRGMVSGPIIDDKVAFRLAVSYGENAPHTENVFDPDVPIGGKQTLHMRAKLLFDITEDLSVTLAGTYFDYDFGQWGATEQTYTPEFWKTLFRLQDPNFEDDFDRRGSSRDGATAIGDGYLLSLNVSYDWGEHNISSVTSYGSYGDDSGGDLEMTAFPLIEFAFENKYWQISEELKVTSPPGDFEYIAGVFAFRSNSDALGEGLLFRDLNTTLVLDVLGTLLPTNAPGVGGLLGGLLNDITGLINGLTGGGLNLFEGDLITCDCILDTLSLAGFGQATWHVTEDLSIKVGGRYTWEHKEFDADLSAADNSIIWRTLLFQAENGYQQVFKSTYTDFSPQISVTYEAFEELTVYATYAQGFRSGSFNVASFKIEDVEFDPESSTNYEFGFKSTLLDGLARINLSFFWTDYEDYQVTTFETITFESSNAEEVRVRGVEMDVTVSPFEGLVLVGSMGYLDGEYVKFTGASCHTLAPTQVHTNPDCFPLQGPVNVPPQTSTDLSGEQLFRAPKWTGSINAIWAFPLSWIGLDNILGLMAGSASYRGFEFIDPDLDPRDSQEAYWLFGARAGLRHIDNLWSLEVQVKNITDEIYKLTSFDAPIALGAHIAQSNPPRTVLVRLRVEI
mgnify:CR=1 FL=1